MKIAFMGIRGIPRGYSGFETFVRELAPRLAERGHKVTVYGRSYHQEGERYRGVALKSFPTIRRKHLETIFHTSLCALHSLFCGYDIVYICIVGNAPVAFLPRIGGAKVLLNVDGADWERGKWGGFAKHYLRWCERVATKSANLLIADAEVIKDRYRELYGAALEFVPYGAHVERDERTDVLDQFGLSPDAYILFVGRLVPENAAELLIEAFKRVQTDRKLVIVGDAPYSQDYKESLRRLAARDVVFTGYVFGDGYRQLSSHAYLYVLASAVDGTRPVLLDQLGFGNCVLVRGSRANLEVIGDKGMAFDTANPLDSLVEKLQYLLDNPDAVEHYRRLSTTRITEKYTWERVTDRYEEVFQRLVGRREGT